MQTNLPANQLLTTGGQMGCWSIDSFGNDHASDFIADLAVQDDLQLVSNTVSAVSENHGEYLEAPDATLCLVAAEVVAAALGRIGPAASKSAMLLEWLSRVRPVPNTRLVANAQLAVKRVLADESELRELWEDSNDFEAWKHDVQALLERLSV